MSGFMNTLYTDIVNPYNEFYDDDVIILVYHSTCQCTKTLLLTDTYLSKMLLLTGTYLSKTLSEGWCETQKCQKKFVWQVIF